MNLQNLFDKVAQHLLTQNAQALCAEGFPDQCAYRSPTGNKCAVGCLIADEHYSPELENKNFLNVKEVREAVINSIKGEADSEVLSPSGDFTADAELMLTNLQTLHDEFSPAKWWRELQHIAEQYNLEWNHEPAKPV